MYQARRISNDKQGYRYVTKQPTHTIPLLHLASFLPDEPPLRSRNDPLPFHKL